MCVCVFVCLCLWTRVCILFFNQAGLLSQATGQGCLSFHPGALEAMIAHSPSALVAGWSHLTFGCSVSLADAQ